MEANDPRARSVQRILLAEDDEDMRRFLVKALEKAGYDVISFGNGLEAYERLKEEPFTLLLTDIVMPEMDGIELARKASELDPDLNERSAPDSDLATTESPVRVLVITAREELVAARAVRALLRANLAQ